jgi:hypothetical protein
MKLSEAIRLGAMATEQGVGNGSLLSTTSTCALGAARFAGNVACLSDTDAYEQLPKRWPILLEKVSLPRDTSHYSACHQRVLMEGVWVLNDCDGWTREEIADWVETIELQTTPAMSRKEVRTEQETATTSASAAK